MSVEVADLVAKLRLDAGQFAKGFKEADKGLLGLIAGGTALGEVMVKGKTRPVAIYELIGLRHPPVLSPDVRAK